MTFAQAPDTEAYPPYLLNFSGTPGERHVENLKILREIGLDAYDKADALVYGPDREWFARLEDTIQRHYVGPDCFWREPGTSKTRGAAQFFGNAWWIPFPPTVVIRYDDGTQGIIRNVQDMQMYVEQNEGDAVRTRRHVRLALRALDGEVVQCVYQDIKVRGSAPLFVYQSKYPQPVGSRAPWLFGRMHYHATSQKVYHHCTLRIRRHGQLPWEGTDFGSGMAIELDYTKSLKVEASAIGLTDDFELTAPLAKFFAQNEDLISKGLDRVEAALQRYRDHYRKECRWKAKVLSYRFLATVYNRPRDPTALNKNVFELERDHRIRDLILNDNDVFTNTFERLTYVTSSEVNTFWYLFWDDLWRRNFDVIKAFGTYASDFDPHYSTSIAYTPLPRAALEAFLVQRGLMSSKGNTGYWFHHGLLNKLYVRLNDVVFQGSSKVRTNSIDSMHLTNYK